MEIHLWVVSSHKRTFSHLFAIVCELTKLNLDTLKSSSLQWKLFKKRNAKNGRLQNEGKMTEKKSCTQKVSFEMNENSLSQWETEERDKKGDLLLLLFSQREHAKTSIQNIVKACEQIENERMREKSHKNHFIYASKCIKYI